MKIIKPNDFKHEQLKNQKTGEPYSLSDLVSKNIGSNQLFFHHDIIPPSLKSSGPHRHSIVEEVVYIIKGSVTVVTGDNQTVLNAGSIIYFDPNEKENHHIINHTDQYEASAGERRCLLKFFKDFSSFFFSDFDMAGPETGQAIEVC